MCHVCSSGSVYKINKKAQHTEKNRRPLPAALHHKECRWHASMFSKSQQQRTNAVGSATRPLFSKQPLFAKHRHWPLCLLCGFFFSTENMIMLRKEEANTRII